MKYLTPFFLTLILFSCSEVETNKIVAKESENESITQEENAEQFQSFLDKFEKVKLPIEIKGCEFDYTKYSSFDDGNSFRYGQIETNGNYIAVVTLGAADCFLPILTTYKKTGEQIDSKTIAIGYCGDGPCFECDEFMTIKEDYSIYTVDTMKTSECDEDYNPILGTESIEITYKKGKLSESGLIELSEELKKIIKE